MTAFLLESYQALKPDPSDTVIELLTQIASQNGTSSSASQRSFTPSQSALQVNVLWFISLILSLATASFGILVKQWLREYLAVKYISPQARLRVRHFRFPGLIEWKVFEIAAVLPLFLQLALGLFFLGLCIFTSSVHSSIGWSTIPLVCGWGMLISFTTLAPIAFPRCPYRTALLKGTLDILHRHFISLSSSRLVKAVRTRLRLGQQWMATCNIRRFLARLRFQRDTFLSDLPLENLSRNDTESVACSFDICTSLYFEPVAAPSFTLCEDDAIKTEAYDLDILLTVDALQTDDELLGTMIRESLSQLAPLGSSMINFVLRTLSHRRSSWNPQIQDLPVNLRSLSKRAWLAVVNIVTDGMTREIQRQTMGQDWEFEWSPWMSHALLLLISPSVHSLPQSANAVITLCLVHNRSSACSTLALPYRTDSGDADIFDGVLQTVSEALKCLDGKTSLSILQELIAHRLRVHHSESFVLSDLSIYPWQRLISSRGLRPVADLLADILNVELDKLADTHGDATWAGWMNQALSAFLTLYTEVPRWTSDADSLIARLLTTNSFISPFLMSMSNADLDILLPAMHTGRFDSCEY